ncbi:MAG: A24 family peptidase [bacterium]|nr:A24 family peptidase [bacterium]
MEPGKIILLMIVLLVSGITDLLRKKVYNIVTFPGIIMGLLLGLYYNGPYGLLDSGLGFILASFIFLALYIWAGFGAGDVKLMMAVGSIVGMKLIFDFILYSAIMGGVMAVIVMIRNRVFLPSMKNVLRFFLFLIPKMRLVPEPLTPGDSFTVPYAYAISMGSLLCLWVSHIQIK